MTAVTGDVGLDDFAPASPSSPEDSRPQHSMVDSTTAQACSMPTDTPVCLSPVVPRSA